MEERRRGKSEMGEHEDWFFSEEQDIHEKAFEGIEPDEEDEDLFELVDELDEYEDWLGCPGLQ